MKTKERCRAITKGGKRCENNAKLAGFCGLHQPRSRLSDFSVKAEVAGALAALAELAVKAVELWQSLPFGIGPKMPPDYKYLSEVIEISPWGSERDHLRVFNKSEASVDWTLVRHVYDGAQTLGVKLNNGALSVEEAQKELERLEQIALSFMDTMQPEIQEMYYEDLGASEQREE